MMLPIEEESFMESYIGLGIVLEPSENTVAQIEKIIDLIEVYSTSFTVTHPKEGDYDDWVEEPVQSTDDMNLIVEKLAYKTSYADINLEMGDYNLETRLQLSNEEKDFLVHFEIDQTSLIRENSRESLEKATSLIKSLIQSIDEAVEYSYIFCDQEAQYLYTKSRLIEIAHNPYAILKMHEREIVQAPWYLDGFTLRNTNH